MILIHDAKGALLYRHQGSEDTVSAAVDAAIEDGVPLTSAVFDGQDAPGNARDFLAVLAAEQDLHADQKVTPTGVAPTRGYA